MDTAAFITAFATLFVVIDPPGLVTLFIALTSGMGFQRRRALAIRACLIAFCLLLVFGLFGEPILHFIGISMPAFRIAGGILLFLTALDMLFERRTERREGKQAEPDHDPSVFPLATPLIAGPGAIATMILLMGEAGEDWISKIAVLGLLVAIMVVTLLFLLAATPLEKMLGRTGTLVITRLLGMLLAALSVQFVIDGIRSTGLIPL
ncbi:MarC family protein [Pseudogemmobacter faecipullorum]|uniref:UPF0056 membrane protein n=1 Tax=Pseudogemmobacter faecipullorum TaxID=2755041 RepID=A0ABS8CK34_9RHOB|nr:MarC family protein [Pseudogemmobacter faecipullorum]MCB5409762.1 MarC family protein [Pseudogemmobacter faecipullorum]